MGGNQDKRKTEIKYQEGEDGVAPLLRPEQHCLGSRSLCSQVLSASLRMDPLGPWGYEKPPASPASILPRPRASLTSAQLLLGSLLPLAKVRKGDSGTCRDWLKSLWAEVMVGSQHLNFSRFESYFACKREFTEHSSSKYKDSQ